MCPTNVRKTKKPRFREAAGRSASTALTHHGERDTAVLKSDQSPRVPLAQITSLLDSKPLLAAFCLGAGADPRIVVRLLIMPTHRRQAQKDHNHPTDQNPSFHSRAPASQGPILGPSRRKGTCGNSPNRNGCANPTLQFASGAMSYGANRMLQSKTLLSAAAILAAMPRMSAGTISNRQGTDAARTARHPCLWSIS